MSVCRLVRPSVISGAIAILFFFCTAPLAAQQEKAQESELARLRGEVEALQTQFESLAKAIDDVLWFNRVGDVAEIDKITYVGPPNPKGREGNDRRCGTRRSSRRRCSFTQQPTIGTSM